MARVHESVVYIIKTHFGTYYTGCTNNLIRRWKEHKKGQSSYLSRVKPAMVVYVEFCNNYPTALKREKQIKNRGAYRWLLHLKFKQGIHNDF